MDSFTQQVSSSLESGSSAIEPTEPKRRRKSKLAQDPLRDPVIRYLLDSIRLSRAELMEISVRDLNKLLIEYPSDAVAKLKRCRRTLKNRGYARSCRIKRIAAKDEIEKLNAKLQRENQELIRRNKCLAEKLSELLRPASQSTSPTSTLASSPSTIDGCPQQTNLSFDDSGLRWSQQNSLSQLKHCCQESCNGSWSPQITYELPVTTAYCCVDSYRSQTNFY